ncbi:MAG: hypothetical protein ACE5D2_07850 [Fidelibacterota bacterium]
MKKLLFLLMPVLALSQSDIYSVDDVYGGGIGFSTMYIVLDSIPGESILKSLGLPKGNIQSRPFIVHGGEGFAQMAGPWRLGGYAGLGSAKTSNVYSTIHLYVEGNDTTGYQTPPSGSSGDITGNDPKYIINSNLTIEARLNFMLGAITVEYVVPVFRDLEVTAGAMMGIGRYSLSINQQLNNPTWDELESNMYGYLDDTNNIYYPVDTTGSSIDSLDQILNALGSDNLRPVNISGAMTELSGTFFNFQPYIAAKWQFLDRMGLRISAGYNKGTIAAGSWKLNSYSPISDSPKSAFQGLTLRIMIYFGL